MGNKKDPKAVKKEQRTNLKKQVKSLAEAINKAKKQDKSTDKKEGFKGKKSFEKKPFEKKPFEKKPFDKKPFDKKPFEKKPFEKKPFSKNSNTGSSSSFNNASNNNAAGKLAGQKRKFDAKFSGDKHSHTTLDKQALKKHRQGVKPNFSLVEELKLLWNKVRTKSTPAEERGQLITKMVTKIQGHVLQITLRHDASRFVQSIIQFSTTEERKKILMELAPKLIEIAKTPYGHFTVLKAINFCTAHPEQRIIVKGLSGHFVSLGTNVIGARIVESIFKLFAPKVVRGLKAEFYGHKYNLLLPEPPKSLRNIIEGLPQKESSILDHMRDLVQRFVDKGLLVFHYVHNFIWEYCREIADKPKKIEDLISQLVESIPLLIVTKAGAKVACFLATYSTAKDRKRYIKTLKGKVLESLLHDAGHLGIMRIVDVTDDTVNVQKSILDEIKSVQPVIKYSAAGDVVGTPLPPLISIAKHRCGRKFLLHLLNPTRQCLEPDEAELFSNDVANFTSKKAPAARRKENVSYLRSPLVAVCAKYAKELVRCRSGARVLEDVVSVFYPDQLMASLARIYAGLEVEDVELVDDLPNEAEEESEEGDEVEGVDEYEGEGDLDMDEAEEDQEGWDVDVDAVEEEEEEEEEAVVVDIKVLEEEIKLPIHEDPVAHLLIRQIFRVEAFAETKVTPTSISTEAAVEEEPLLLDDSLWDTSMKAAGSSSNSTSRFSTLLLGCLQERSGDEEPPIVNWLKCNRSCLALSDMFKIPSAKKILVSLLNQHEAILEASGDASDGHTGGKLLKGLYESARPIKEQKLPARTADKSTSGKGKEDEKKSLKTKSK